MYNQQIPSRSIDFPLIAALAGSAVLGASLVLAGAAALRRRENTTSSSSSSRRQFNYSAPGALGLAADDTCQGPSSCTPGPRHIDAQQQQEEGGALELLRSEQQEQQWKLRQQQAGEDDDGEAGDFCPRLNRKAGAGSRDQYASNGNSAFATSISLVSPVDAKKRSDPYDCRPRQGFLQWDDYFMSVAFLSAQRSKDPNKQVGAVIVSEDKIILSIGYNGFPRGCPDHRLPWAKKSRGGNVLDTKYPYVVHAEANALLNKNQASVEGARVYVTMFPCNECAKLLIQAGITEVVYHESKVESVKHHPALVAPLNADSSSSSSNGNSGNGGGCSHGSGSDGDGGGSDADCGGMGAAGAADADARAGGDQRDEDSFSFHSNHQHSRNSCGGANPASRKRAGGSKRANGDICMAQVAVGAPDAGYVASRRLLTMAGVTLRQHKLRGLIIVNPSS